MSSPTQRSLALLRGQGYLCYVAERWNQYARKRQDMYGFVDIVAVRADTVGVKSTQSRIRYWLRDGGPSYRRQARYSAWIVAT